MSYDTSLQTVHILTQPAAEAPWQLSMFLQNPRHRVKRAPLRVAEIVVGLQVGNTPPMYAGNYQQSAREHMVTMTMRETKINRFVDFFRSTFGEEISQEAARTWCDVPRYNCFGFAGFVAGDTFRAFSIELSTLDGKNYSPIGNEPTIPGIAYLIEKYGLERPHAFLTTDDGESTVSTLGTNGPLAVLPFRNLMKHYGGTTILKPE